MNFLKRTLSIILVICMISTQISLAAFAQTDSSIQSVVPSTDIQQDGEYMDIVIEGIPYAIEEVLKMIDEGVSLDTVAEVDGTEFTLEDLLTMIEIEKELKDFEDTYISGQGEKSFVDKLATSAITKELDSNSNEYIIISPSGIDHETRVSVYVDSIENLDNNTDYKCKVHFELNKPAESLIIIDYQPERIGCISSFDESSNINECGDIVLNIGDKSVTLDLNIEKKEVSIENSYLTFLNFSNIENALFEGDEYSKIIPIVLETDFDLDNIFPEGNYIPIVTLDELYAATSSSAVQLDDNSIILGGESSTVKIEKTLSKEIVDYIDNYIVSNITYPQFTIINDNGLNGLLTVNAYLVDKEGYTWNKSMKTIDVNEETGDIEYSSLTEAIYHYPSFDKIIFELSWESSEGDIRIKFTEDEEIKGLIFFSDREVSDIEYLNYTEYWNNGLAEDNFIQYRFEQPYRSSEIELVVGDKTYKAIEPEGDFTKHATFQMEKNKESPIQIYSPIELKISETLSGNKGGSIYTDNDIMFYGINIIRYLYSEPVVTITGSPIELKGEIKVKVSKNEEFNTVFDDLFDINSDGQNEFNYLYAKVYNDESEESEDISLIEVAGTDGKEIYGTFNIPINDSNQNKIYYVEFYRKNVIDNITDFMVEHLSTPYEVDKIEFPTVEDISIEYENWPDNNRVYTSSAEGITLKPYFDDDAYWADKTNFSWTSSNEDVARIDSNGKVILNGEGKTTFSLECKSTWADYNPMTDETTWSGYKPITIESEQLEVVEKEGSFLVVPSHSKHLETYLENDIVVHFNSNVAMQKRELDQDSEPTKYTMTLYETDSSDDYIDEGVEIFKIESTDDEASIGQKFIIDSSYLTKPSKKGEMGYVLEIKVEDFNNATLKEFVEIEIKSLPVDIKLNIPDIRYTTDSKTEWPIEYTVDNYNIDDNPEFYLNVYKNYELIDNMPQTVINDAFSVPVSAVASEKLYDYYKIDVKAKNERDEVYSVDSYCFYVYNTQAVSIAVDNIVEKDININYHEYFMNITGGELLDWLQNMYKDNKTLNINNNGFRWRSYYDRFTWTNSNNDVVDLIAKTTDESIQNNSDYFYLPQTKFDLKTIGEGKTTITANHILLEENATIDVMVKGTENPVYYFSVSTRQKTTLEYTNGDGNLVQKETNSDGDIAIYEPSGIDSKILFNSYIDNDFYVAEFDAPAYGGKRVVNNDIVEQIVIEMTPFALPNTITITNPNGSPYSGNAVLRGGFYRNNFYYPDTKVNGKLGSKDQTVYIRNGNLKIDYDIMELSAEGGLIQQTDQIDLRLEVKASDTTNGSYTYEPVICEIDLSNNEHEYIKLVEYGKYSVRKNIIQYIYQYGKKRAIDDYIINTENWNNAYLVSEAIVENDADYSMNYYSEGGEAYNSSKEPIKYPFSSFSIIKSKTPVNDLVFNGKPGQSEYLELKIKKSSKTVVSIPNIVKLVNMEGVPNLISGTEIINYMQNLLDDIVGSIEMPSLNVNASSILNKALDFLPLSGPSEKMLQLDVIETDDPCTVRAIVKIAVGDMAKTNAIGVNMDSEKDVYYSKTPGYAERKVVTGGYIAECKKQAAEAKEKSKTKGGYRDKDILWGGGGVYEFEVRFNPDTQKIEYDVINNYTNIGGGINYYILYNASGLTGKFELGCAVDGGYGNLDDKGEEAILKSLRAQVYLAAFGGLGFDYKIVSAKCGAFGQISYEHEKLKLKYPELNSKKIGRKDSIYGKTGIKAEVKFFWFKKTKILASKYFSSTSSDSVYNYINNLRNSFINYFDLALEEMNTIESRMYLSAGLGTWSTESLGIFSSLQTNAYPNSNPQFTTDGDQLFMLMDNNSTDINETSVGVSQYNGNGYDEPTEITVSEYGDSNMDIAGNSSFSIATWERTMTKMVDTGEELTNDELLEMVNNSEIIASVNSSSSVETQLTDNDYIDFAPAAATNGEKGIVVWRSALSSDMDDIFNFDCRDMIMYALYDGSNWSDAKVLYDGAINHIQNLDVEMTEDGKATVVFQVERAGESTDELMIATFNDSKNFDISRLTTNESQDTLLDMTVTENSDGNDQVFAAWYTGYTDQVQENTMAIELSSGNEGVLLTGLTSSGDIDPEYITFVPSTIIEEHDLFCFSKGSNTLDDLSIIWREIENEEETSQSYVYGMKFEDSGTFELSPKLELYNTSTNKVIEYMDVAAIGDELRISLLNSDYDIDIPVANYTIETINAKYNNQLIVEDTDFNVFNIIPNMDTFVEFELYNDSYKSLENIKISVGESSTILKNAMEPGETLIVNIPYTVPDTLENPVYKIEGLYDSDAMFINGTLPMKNPDIGIGEIENIKEDEKERVYLVELKNELWTPITLPEQYVQLEVYDNSALAGEPLAKVSITDPTSIQNINEDSFVQTIILGEETLVDYLNEDGEISENTILFFVASIVNGGASISEVFEDNNRGYDHMESLIDRYMEDFTTSCSQTETDSGSVFNVDIRNNSMQKVIDGDLIITLKNSTGEILETKHLYDEMPLEIEGEETITVEVPMNFYADDFEVSFSASVPINTRLKTLIVDRGILKFDPSDYVYYMNLLDESIIGVTYETNETDSLVTVFLDETEVVDPDQISLSSGVNTITIVVKKDSSEATYTIYVDNEEVVEEENNTSKHNSQKQKEYASYLTVEIVDGAAMCKVDHNELIKLGDTSNNTVLVDLTEEDISEIHAELSIETVKYLQENDGIISILTSYGQVDIPAKAIDIKDYEDESIVRISLCKDSEQGIIFLEQQIDGIREGFFNEHIELYMPLSNTGYSAVVKEETENAIKARLFRYEGGNAVIKTMTDGLYKMCSFSSIFDDIAGHWSESYVMDMARKGIVNGKKVNMFMPEDSIKRDEFVIMIARALGMEASSENPFVDVSDDSWYCDGVIAAYQNDLINGKSENIFDPEAEIKREEAMVIIANIIRFIDEEMSISNNEINTLFDEYSDVDTISDWARESVALAVKAGIINGKNGMILPRDNITRAESAKVIDMLMKYLDFIE